MRGIPLLFWIAVGCGPTLLEIPSRGGPTWVELQSEHFTLWTDAGATRGRELVGEMEHLRQVIYGVAFPHFATDERSLVIALRDLDEVQLFVPKEFIAFTFQPNIDGFRHPTIVIPADRRPDSYGDVVTHELVHLISDSAIHHQPAWFAEGVATFFETTRIDIKTGHVDVGSPAPSMTRGISRMRPLPSASLFACQKVDCRDFRFYVTAWALYSYLINAHAEELTAFEAALDRGQASDRAWDEAFTSLHKDAVDREVFTWLISGHHVVWHFNATLAEHAVAERPLADADVYAIRALLGFHFQRRDPTVRSDVAAALALAPQHTLALAVQRAVARTSP